MKKYFFLAVILFSSIVNIVAQETKDVPRLYWGYYHSDIDNDYLSKTSIARWVKGQVPIKIITTETATEIPVTKIELTVSAMQANKKSYTTDGDALSAEMKQALLNVNSGNMINIVAHFTNGKKPQSIRLEFAVE